MIVVYTRGEGMLYLNVDVYKYDNNINSIIIDTKDTGKHIIPMTEIIRIQIRCDNDKDNNQIDPKYIYEKYHEFRGIPKEVNLHYEPLPSLNPGAILIDEGYDKTNNYIFAIDRDGKVLFYEHVS